MRLAWVRSPFWPNDWVYQSGKYRLLVWSPTDSNEWCWDVGRKLSGLEPDEHQARAAAEMALDDLLAADEESAREKRELEKREREQTGSANRYAQSAAQASPTLTSSIGNFGGLSSPTYRQPHTRVYFDGCEGSGKTSLARKTAKRYGLPLLTEVASAVLYEFQQRVGERASSWERIRADVELSSEVQARVFQRQLEDERALPPPAVYDRTLSCLAYAQLYADNFPELLARVPPEYVENLRQSIVFLVRPQRDLLGASDGVRAIVSWESQVRVDQNIESLLDMWRVSFVSVDSLNAAARQRTVDWCMRARGFSKVKVTG